MNRLVLDLRNNPGGYMDQAIKMANEFFPRNVGIVSSKSRHSRFSQKYYSYSQGTFQTEPLIILVNEGSASASEIVSGAVQDNDRGLIVGARTFGKGLVQQQYELADGSAIRVTISRYYTPSGRLIQKPYSDGREDYAYELLRRPDNPATDAREFIVDIPDSLKFETALGRPVYAGGGILPDHIIEDDTTRSYLFGFMRRKRAATDYIVKFVDENGESFKATWEENFSGYRKDFKWSEAQLSDFDSIMANKGLIIRDTVSSPHYTASFDTLYMSPQQRQREQWIVEDYLKAELATRIWGTKRFWTIFNDAFDVTLKRAMELWPEVDALRGYAENVKTGKGRG
jgi:carboxyl-terminal processing protease